MSFANRLSKRPPMVIAAVKPDRSMNVSLCLPRVLTLEGQASGMVSLPLSPLVVGGIESTRLLTAMEELLAELLERATEEGEALDSELCEASVLVRRHLDSISAALELAEQEHDATHQHERGSN